MGCERRKPKTTLIARVRNTHRHFIYTYPSLSAPRVGNSYLKNQTEDVTPHAAAFLLFREAGWYFFGSTGWLDEDWQWEPVYDKLAACGKPEGAAAYDSAGVLRRSFAGCSVFLNCTGDGKGSCVAGVEY